MEFSSFFDYPSPTGESRSEALPFLHELSEESRHILLSFAERRSFSRGEDILRVGDVGRALYIVSSGRLEVLVLSPQSRAPHRIATIAPGSIFGELAFFDAQARSATVRGLETGEMHALTLDAFEALANEHPELSRHILFDLGRILAHRLRHMTAIAAEWLR